MKTIKEIADTMTKDKNLEASVELLQKLVDEAGSHFDDEEELEDMLKYLCLNYMTDFIYEFDGATYRIIHSTIIDSIYKGVIKEIVTDCYSTDIAKVTTDLPSFIAWSIDWDKTAENAKVDGYGHTFATYDGEELETRFHHIFRID